MPIELPEVYVAMVDGVTNGLAQLAFDDSYRQVEFGGFNRADAYSLEEVENWMWYGSFRPAFTFSHVLFIQWDGFVLDGSLWNPDWLQYDYIGAPWPWHKDGLTVGNGGFSLRSVRLLKFLSFARAEFPVKTPEDDTLCRLYRQKLEYYGFVWAPEHVAAEFSWERGPRPSKPTFGFHGMFNLPRVLSPEKWYERKALMETNSYITSKVEWQEVKDL